ncbi:Protein C10A4.1, partial [Aphelenchoides avenae]
MLKLFCSNRAAIELLINSASRDHEYPIFEEGDWALMKQTVEVLEPLALATVGIQGRLAHIGVVLPIYFKLLELLRNNGGQLSKAKKAIAESLQKRMSGWRTNEVMLLATALDPRYKLQKFGESVVADEVKQMLKDRAHKVAEQMLGGESPEGNDSDASEESSGGCAIAKLLSLESSTKSPVKKKSRPAGTVDPLQKANVEVETYLSSKLSKEPGRYKYWREHKSTMPLLYALTERYLSAPATSAESER